MVDLPRAVYSSPEVKDELDEEAATVHLRNSGEAVRLALTSGQTPREIKEEVWGGRGLLTHVRWIGSVQDRLVKTSDQASHTDHADEFKRLPRENETPRQSVTH